jgi:hypothetical protein
VDEDVRRGQKRDTSRGYDVVRGDVAEGLGRGLQSLAQRFESARRLVRGLVVVVSAALVLAGCGSDPYESSTHDAQTLTPELSELPSGFSLDPGESFPVPTSKILAEPFSASSSALIRRERLYGYQAGFTSPRGRPIECTAAVYRSSAAARKVFRLRTESVAAFVAESGGRSLRVGTIGEESYGFRDDLEPVSHEAVAWRFRNVLSTCIGPLAEILVIARVQQARIARALG